MDGALDPVRALDAALSPWLAATAPTGVAVAYSGGADSTALLHATAALAAHRPIEVVALHVHHGLAAAADDWLAHCRDHAAAVGVAFDATRVTPQRDDGSLEAGARRLRYAALVALCRRHRCELLLTAHHADDQAETVLLNLARGAGVGGLAGMARCRVVDGVTILRPWLDLPGARLRAYAAASGLAHVDDPSNADRRYTRNAIRHEVLPPFARIAPSIASRIARTAQHAQSMQGLLDEIGIEDLGPIDDADELDTDRLATLSDARAANALRVWLARRGMRPPSTAALREMLQQLLHASPDAQIALLHERQTLRVYRGRVSIDPSGVARAGFRALAWHGEPRIDVPDWRGALTFTATDGPGVDATALKAGPLSLRERRGGERLRTRRDGPSRTLKNLYQEAGIPAWRRASLPLLYLGDRLLMAAGLGCHASALTETAVERVAIAWIPAT